MASIQDGSNSSKEPRKYNDPIQTSGKSGSFFRCSDFYPIGANVVVPLTAEFIGMFFLTFIGSSQQVSFTSASLTQNVNSSLIPLHSLDEMGGRLASPVVVGITLALLINSLVHLSGANLNPTASVTFLTTGDLPWQLFVPYLVAQVLGSTVGAAIMRALMPEEKYILGSGGMLMTIGDPVKAFGVEVVICFFMMFIACTAGCDQNANSLGAYSTGFTVTVSLYAFGPVTGACMNPARSMGAIISAYGADFGPGTSALFHQAWLSTGIYFAGDFLGAFLAGMVFRKIAKNEKYGVSWRVLQKCGTSTGQEKINDNSNAISE